MMETKANTQKMVGEGVGFERIRRITGYLVGTVDHFNNAKRAEEQGPRETQHFPLRTEAQKGDLPGRAASCSRAGIVVLYRERNQNAD